MNYDDIIGLSRPESGHPRMHRQDRAKIFAPFAALNGHDKALQARGRVLTPKLLMSSHSQEILDQKLRQLQKGDTVTVTWFTPLKSVETEILGEYRTAADVVIRVDANDRMLYLDSQKISFDDLMDILPAKENPPR